MMLGTSAARTQQGVNHENKVAREKADQWLEEEQQSRRTLQRLSRRQSGGSGRARHRGTAETSRPARSALPGLRESSAFARIWPNLSGREGRAETAKLSFERKSKKLFNKASPACCGGCFKPTRQTPTDTRAGGELPYAPSRI